MDIHDGEVHLWRIALDASLRAPPPDEMLSTDELARARSFRFDVHRRRYVSARAAVRTLLGSYVGEAPARLRFAYGPRGKPELAGHARMQFNVSHAHELAVCAVARGIVLGVDVEHIRPIERMEQVAGRYFTARESAAIARAERAARPAAFFRCWTRKEAVCKATGLGLSVPLDSFDVQCELAEAECAIRTGEQTTSWLVRSFTAGDEYVGGLAAAASRYVVREMTFHWGAARG